MVRNNMNNIDIIYNMMDWQNDEALQKSGRALAENLVDLSPLIMPIGKKSIWENCARVIAEKSDHVLRPYLFRLLIWLQDMNWPGAFIIAERLKKVNVSILSAPLSEAIDIAQGKADDIWLDYLAIFIECREIEQYLSAQRYNLLVQHYKNFWDESSG